MTALFPELENEEMSEWLSEEVASATENAPVAVTIPDILVLMIKAYRRGYNNGWNDRTDGLKPAVQLRSDGEWPK